MVLSATLHSLVIAVRLLPQASMIARERTARLPPATAAARRWVLNRKFTITQVNVRYDV